MISNSFEKIPEKKDVYPTELVRFIENNPELAITGSIAFYLQTGLSFDEAITKANDVDIFCDGEKQVELLQTGHVLSPSKKRVNIFSQQNRFKFKTTKKNFIEKMTEYGPVSLIPLDVMASIDLERARDFLENEEYRFDNEKFKKLYEKLNKYVEVIEDIDLRKKLENIKKEFSLHID